MSAVSSPRPTTGRETASPPPVAPPKKRDEKEREKTPAPVSIPQPPFPRRTSSASKASQLPAPSSDPDRAKSLPPASLPPFDKERDRDLRRELTPIASKSAASTPTKEVPPEPPIKEQPIINMDTFNQILEMDDDDEDREFSKDIVYNFFDQASETLTDMEKAIEKEDLLKLSDLGHFLKGSSGALGIDKVQASCERMQHYGKLRDEEKHVDLTRSNALKMIMDLHSGLKVEYAEAEKWLRNFFEPTD